MSDDADAESQLTVSRVAVNGIDTSASSPLPEVDDPQPQVAASPRYSSPPTSPKMDKSETGETLVTAPSSESLPVPMVRFLQSGDEADDQVAVRHRPKHLKFQDMIDAAKEGRAKDLEELMGPPQPQNYQPSGKGKKVFQVDKKDGDGYTMLHYAARNNHTNVCDVLLRRGADINTQGPDFMTPLHLAAKYRRSRTKAAQAMNQMTQASSLDLQPGNPLRMTKMDDQDAVHFLLINRADFTLKDFYGCTPLHYGAMKGNVVACRCLLNYETKRQRSRGGVDSYSSSVPIWRITDNEDMTPLHLACAHKEGVIVKMLIEVETNDKDYLDMVENTGCTALHLASAEGDADICSYLLHAAEEVGEGFLKRYINRKDMENNTSLHSAVENECVEVAEMLLNRGAFVNACNTSQETPLHLAARTGNTELVELLIQHSARLDALDSDKQNALHKAAYFNQDQLLSYLLEKDSSVIDVTDSEENTPLLLASCQDDNPSCVKILLSKGANPLCSDGLERTAVYLAAMWHNTNVLQALLENSIVREHNVIDEADVNNNTPLHVACEKGFLDIVELLLRNKAKYDDKNEDEETPIHLAAKGGHIQIVRRLLRLSRNLANDEDEDSNTPLHLASLAGQAKICQVLIEEGKADVEARNSRGWTALDCAASKGFTKVAQVLLDNDSPIDPADKSNVTPLFLACQGGHLEMVELLLKIGASVSNRIKYSDVKSPLHNCNCLDAAIDNGHKKVAITLINSEQWKEALRNETVGEKGEKDTPLRKLIRKMPTVAEKVFNKCVENNKQRRSPDDPEYKVVFYYEFLDDMYSSWGPMRIRDSDDHSSAGRGGGSSSNASDSESIAEFSATTEIYDSDGRLRSDLKFKSVKGSLKKNHPLMVMVRKKREDLLLHPLVAALLRHKWISYGRWVYYINLGLYALFLAAFTAYMLSTTATYQYYGPQNKIFNITGWTSNECEQVLRVDSTCKQPQAAAITKWFVIVLGALFLLKEVSQIFMNRLKYLNFENLMDWSIFSLAILTVIDISDCQKQCGVRTFWQWNTGSFGILLSWLNLVLFLRKMPRFGIYVVMFTEVLQTFIRFSLVFFLFILSFGITFSLLLRNQIPFDDVLKSLLKTSVMMIGEFEFDAIFNAQYESQELKDVVFYDTATYIVFVVFLIVMSIIIMNLLVGLAVDDIKGVMDQASLKRLAMQIEMALDVEAFLPFQITRRFVIKSESYFPNPPAGSRFSIVNLFRNRWISRDKLDLALNPELDQWEQIYRKQDETGLNLISVKLKVKDMRVRITKIESMLSAIADKLGVEEAKETADFDHEEEDMDHLVEI